MMNRGMLKTHKSKELCFKVFLTISLFIILFIIGSLKSGYHVDEMFTFGLSNHQYVTDINPDIIEGETYSGTQLWAEYTMVDADNTFDYANVWENQKHDSHPPLYYTIIHTVYSFIPEVFNFQYALAINIVFALIAFWQLVWLFNFFIDNRNLSLLFSLMFTFTMGFVNSIVFFRMYMLLTVWTNALIILFCKNKPEDNHWTYYVSLALILTGGTLTQYYFIIFAFFACAVYAVRVALKKNWGKIGLSVLMVLLSIGLSSFIFPSMWTQIFSGYRGQEAFSNISRGGFWGYIWEYLELIDLRVFGDVFLFLILAVIILFIVSSREESAVNSELKQNVIAQYLQVVVPIIGDILIIAQISPYRVDRYVMNIMGLMYLVVFSVLILLALHFSKQALLGVFTLAAIVLFCSYKEGVPYLYISEAENVETIAELGDDIPCIYIYDTTWKIMPNYVEMTDLNNIEFFKNNNLDALDDDKYHHYNDLLVYITADDPTKIVDQILEMNPDLTSSTKLFFNGYATAYHLF